MPSSTAMKKKQADKGWLKLFKNPEPNTDHDSVLYQSRIAYICITQYLLHRGLMPLGVFEKRRITDSFVIHTFKNANQDGSVNRWGTKLSEMMKGMTEAILHKYARQAIVMINESPNEPDSATEVFTIGFAYNPTDCVQITDSEGNEVVNLSYKGKEAFRQQIVYIMERIKATARKLPKIRADAKPLMKLTYYDERVPIDYQPTAFKMCSTTYTFPNGKPKQMQLSSINSNYGALAIDLQSEYITDLEELEEDLLEERETMEQIFTPPEPTVSLDGSGSVFGREMIEVRRSSPQFVAPSEEPKISPKVSPPAQLVEDEVHPKSVRRGNRKRLSPQSMASKVTKRRKATDESTTTPTRTPSRSPTSTTGIRESYVPRHPTVSSGRQQATPENYLSARRVLWPNANLKSETSRSMAMSPDDHNHYG